MSNYKELGEGLGFTFEGDEVTKEQFVEQLNAHYVPLNQLGEHEKVAEIVNSQFGKKIGSFETEFKALAREKGLQPEKWDDKDISANVNKVLQLASTKIQELEGGIDRDEEYKKLQGQLSSIQENYEKAKSQAEEYSQKYSQLESSFEGYKTQAQLNAITDQAYKSIPFSENANELTMIGFKQKVNEKYNLALASEEDKTNNRTADGLYITDKNGKLVADGVKPLSYQEILAREAKEMNLLKVNNGNEKTPPTVSKDKPEGVKQFKIHPKAAKTLDAYQDN